MTDTLLLIGILSAWFGALALMPRLNKKANSPKFRAIEAGESGTYDPALDEHRKMSGETESYFD